MKRILVLGGTGAMGRYLKDELLKLGYEVFITTRQNRPNACGVSYMCGNAHDTVFLKRVLEEVNPDAIVDFMSYSTEEFRARADLLVSASSQYIFLSTYRVFNDASPIVETSPRLLDTIDDSEYLKTDEYALCKARCEDILRAFGNTNWTIVRPSIIYSNRCFKFGCLEANTVCYRALHNLPVVMPSEMLDKETTLTWGGDAAKMIARLVLNKKAYGEAFNIATAEHHTWRDVAEIYSKHLGMRLMEISLTDYCHICNEKQVMYDRMFMRIMDNSKILNVTGLSQTDFKTLDKGLGGEMDANRNELSKIQMNIKQNACIDALCGIVSLPHGSVGTKIYYLKVRFPFLGFLISSAIRSINAIRSLIK